MGESLIVRRRVRDEGLRIVNLCRLRANLVSEYVTSLILAGKEGTANSVPAAAVIQRSQALFGFTGRKACVGGEASFV